MSNRPVDPGSILGTHEIFRTVINWVILLEQTHLVPGRGPQLPLCCNFCFKLNCVCSFCRTISPMIWNGRIGAWNCSLVSIWIFIEAFGPNCKTFFVAIQLEHMEQKCTKISETLMDSKKYSRLHQIFFPWHFKEQKIKCWLLSWIWNLPIWILSF